MRQWFICCSIFVLSVIGANAEDIDVKKIINEIKSTYESMQSYSSDVGVYTDLTINGQSHKSTTKGHLKLLRPNFYNITWSNDASLKGKNAIWNSGNGPLYFIGKIYRKPENDLMNFATGTGVSSSITYTLPYIFFKEEHNFLSRLQNLRFINMESMNGDECYVIEASNKQVPKITLWISKNQKIILQIITNLKDGTMKEVFENSQINPKLEKQSLDMAIPEDATFRE